MKPAAHMIIVIVVLMISLANDSLKSQIRQGVPCLDKNYNIIAHVAVDSSDRKALHTASDIDSILAITTQYFEDICISFSLCEFHVLENDYTLGILKDNPVPIEVRFEELKNRFNKRRRINVYFLNSIDLIRCGESTYRGILTEKDANVYVENDCEDGLPEQLAHLLGHTFGLRDTYDSESIELVDGSNCAIAADRLCSTPADPFEQDYISPADEQRLFDEPLVQEFYNEDCEFIYELRDPNDAFYNPIVTNIMSGYPCKCSFTREQYLLMVETILQSTIKHF